jgi:Zn-dependent metalloprotease
MNNNQFNRNNGYTSNTNQNQSYQNQQNQNPNQPYYNNQYQQPQPNSANQNTGYNPQNNTSYQNQNSYNTQQNSYNNQQNQYNQYNNQYQQQSGNYNNNSMNYNQPVNSYQQPNKKQKKVKKKRKHRFLKFLLKVAILIIAIKGLIYLGNSKVQKEFDQFAIDYPFEFENESDCLYYVTSNITVPTSYEYADKTYDVSWSSKNKYLSISDGNITVTRPYSSSSTATLTCTYKKWYGKGTQEYTLTIIPSSTLSVSDISVVTMDSVKNQEYTRDMELELNDDEYIKDMYGDFGSTYVYSADDAKSVIRAYSSELGLDDSIELTLDNTVQYNDSYTYWFSTSYNGIKYDGEAIRIITTNSKLKEIASNIKQHDLSSITEVTFDIESALDNYFDEDYVYAEDEQVLSDNNEVLQKVYVYTESGIIYTVYINSNNEVVSCQSDTQDLFDELDDYLKDLTTIDADGKDEIGETYNFKASSVIGGYKSYYTLSDSHRNIKVYQYMGVADALKQNLTTHSGKYDKYSLVEAVMNGSMVSSVDSTSTTFDNPVAVESYAHIIEAYDWYKKTFNLYSYDNRGSEIDIITDYSTMHDNAAWQSLTERFVVCPAKNLKYTVALKGDVLGHEYTHAVFDANVGAEAFDSTNNIELSALNEAYADIFGCLVSGSTDWQICGNYWAEDGSEVIYRDIINFNSDKVAKTQGIFPTTYKGENWEDEEHNESIIVSHVAYKMWASDQFNSDDVAKIWYKSLTLGFDSDATFVNCRKNVIRSAEELGYTDEQVDFIANEFDLVEIFDDTYVFKTKSAIQPVDGDSILDNGKTKTFIVVYSPMGLALNAEGGEIVIYEEKGALKIDESAMSEKLTTLFHEAGMTNITVVYKQASKLEILAANKFCEKAEGNNYKIITSKLGISDDDEEMVSIFKWIAGLVFQFDLVEATPYNFYKDLLLEVNSDSVFSILDN